MEHGEGKDLLVKIILKGRVGEYSFTTSEDVRMNF